MKRPLCSLVEPVVLFGITTETCYNNKRFDFKKAYRKNAFNNKFNSIDFIA